MKIKIISDACVKVLMETEDINRYNVPFYALSQNDSHSMEFICELLFIILEQTGISFLEDDLSIEATVGYGGNYYILISRSNQASGIHFKKDGHYLEDDMFIYSFKTPQDIRGLITCFSHFKKFYPTQSALYELGGKYYIVLNFSAEQTKEPDFKKMELLLGEYFQKCRRAFETEGVLCERGHLICCALLPLILNKITDE